MDKVASVHDPDCFRYFRVHLNFGNSINLKTGTEWNYDPGDVNHDDFLKYSEDLMNIFEQNFPINDQEITPIQIKGINGDAYVFIDIGCPVMNSDCVHNDLDANFRKFLGKTFSGDLSNYHVEQEGYKFYQLGNG